MTDFDTLIGAKLDELALSSSSDAHDRYIDVFKTARHQQLLIALAAYGWRCGYSYSFCSVLLDD